MTYNRRLLGHTRHKRDQSGECFQDASIVSTLFTMTGTAGADLMLALIVYEADIADIPLYLVTGDIFYDDIHIALQR